MVTADKKSNNRTSRYLKEPGDYLFQIEEIEPHVSLAGNECVKLGFRVVYGKETGKLFSAILPRRKKAMARFLHFLRACGKDESILDTPEELIGCLVCATLVEKEWNGKKRLNVSSVFKDRSSAGVNAVSGSSDAIPSGVCADTFTIHGVPVVPGKYPDLPFSEDLTNVSMNPDVTKGV